MDELSLTRRQFNFRISRLTVGKFVKKVNNKYSLTESGEEAYNAIKIIENAARVQARVKAVDIIKFSECSVDEEMDRIINTLIHNEPLRGLTTQTSPHQRLERS
jgi:hypothetical protein